MSSKRGNSLLLVGRSRKRSFEHEISDFRVRCNDKRHSKKHSRREKEIRSWNTSTVDREWSRSGTTAGTFVQEKGGAKAPPSPISSDSGGRKVLNRKLTGKIRETSSRQSGTAERPIGKKPGHLAVEKISDARQPRENVKN